MREIQDRREYWITPPEIYQALDKEFKFNYDPCPYPFNGIDGTETEWGSSTYLNPPFRKSDGKFGKGPTAFIRKAIEENKKGKTVVILINTNAFINMLIEAGAEMRSMKRVKWLDGKTGQPWKSPSNTTCFILRGNKHKNNSALSHARLVVAKLKAEIAELKAQAKIPSVEAIKNELVIVMNKWIGTPGVPVDLEEEQAKAIHALLAGEKGERNI